MSGFDPTDPTDPTDPSGSFSHLTAQLSRVRQRKSAGALRRAGCLSGDRVAIVAHNHPDVLCLVIGALRCAPGGTGPDPRRLRSGLGD
jgi:acyl-CoA synthetase (AMP-forming)/AMP-acid ligase II